jgi:nucleoside-diphosphate-sugar epimerase
VHVEDVARAYAAALIAPDEAVTGQTFNVVRSGENYRIIDVADAVVDGVPGCVRSKPTDVFDKRSYRVDGTKLARALPRLSMRWSLEQGIRQLRDAFSSNGLTPGLWRSDRFRRMLRLQSQMERGTLDSMLRQTAPQIFAEA